jgi:4-carboxymuconolactone decarboxylase
MRLKTPRISPVHVAEWSPAQREALAPYAARDQLYNIFTTLARVPEALKAFAAWGGFVLGRSSLPERQRELLILRVGWNCRAGYEWAQHARIGRAAGLSGEELAGIKRGHTWPKWSDSDRVLLVAADELGRSQFVSDPTWSALAQHFSERQLMDVVFVVAHYTQVCMILNTFGVQLDPILRADPDLEPNAPVTESEST